MASMNRMHMANSFDPSEPIELPETERNLLERRQQVLGAPYRLFYQKPVHLVRGEGVLLYDADGRDYLDAYNNVPVVGHSNRLVQERVSAQLGILNTHTRYLGDDVIRYAERVTELLGNDLDQAVFVCTGSEAVDLALRVSRYVTGRVGVLATSHAYHGTTAATAEISPSLGPNNQIPDCVELVQAPDLATEDPAQAGINFASRVRTGIENLERRGYQPAALIIDSIMSSDGLQGTSPLILQRAAEVIRAAGGLYIADEVQPGFGRTGSWWGFTGQGVQPDLVVTGKPMGNGIPLAGLFGKKDILEKFGQGVRYFNTFGGNPVSIAAGEAVLDEIINRNLIENAQTVGAQLLEELVNMSTRFDRIGSVRGLGLFFAVDIVDATGAPDATVASQIVNHMRDNRVLISASGPYANVLKIRPPLVFGAEHSPRLLEALENAVRQAR